jgi:dTDP-4-amino-4,6-dideoxygalactose transaminase
MTIENLVSRISVPFVDLASQFDEIAVEVIPQIQSALESAAYIGGSHVSEFEAAYAGYAGSRYCIGVGNGTDAIELCLRASGIGVGDEVIVPANSFIATAEAVSRAGAVPVFVDVDPQHLLIDPTHVEAAISSRTRAIIPVHLFGQCAPVERLTGIAAEHELVVVEDAAQAHGASRHGIRAGTSGVGSGTSFYPGKNLGAAGDAGAVLTNDEVFAERVRTIAAHGSRRKYVHDIVGLNSRLDAVQAVVLQAKLSRLERWNEMRRAAASRYSEALSAIDMVGAPAPAPGNVDVWHLYVVQIDERDRVIEDLASAGIGTGIHYPTPIHLTGAYGGEHRRGEFPVAEASAQRILSLPMFPHISEAQQEAVVDRLVQSVGRGR